MKPATIREQWGARHFRLSPTKTLESLPLRQADRELLRDVGLPVGPKTPLRLFLRFEDVEIIHRPRGVCLLEDAGIQKAKKYPKTGHSELDRWVDLTQFVVIGETDRGPIEYAEAGTGEPILYFHGTGVTADAMVAVEASLIDDGFRLIIPNRPGYGKTPLSTHHSATDCANVAAHCWIHWA
jgi:hypothetical protein